MAKLNGVKTLDMVNGEITKVEYDGAVYTKKGARVKSDDLLLVTDADAIGDVIQGGFYEADDDREGGVCFLDEDNDLRCAELWSGDKTCLVFSKVTEVASPIETRVGELERRVDALEDPKGEPLKVGDYAKVINAKYYTMSGFKNGDIVLVTGSDFGHKVGTIGEVVPAPEFFGTDIGVLANGIKKSHIGQMELITPVEARFDR